MRETRTAALIGLFLIAAVTGASAEDGVKASTDAGSDKPSVRVNQKHSKHSAKAHRPASVVAAEDALTKAQEALAKAQEALEQAHTAQAEAHAASTQAAEASTRGQEALDKYKAAFPPPPPADPNAKAAPFSFADFGWLNGNSRTTDSPLDGKVFSGEFRLDSNYVYDFAHPADKSLSGSTNTNRSGEFQVEQLGVGGDFHLDHVRGRIMTQFGMYSTSQPRNDASSVTGQWDLTSAYRYLSEAYGGYHWDKWYGINLDVGLFMSYIGLCSYYNFDNWIYQMSYVSANTPWYFNGVRAQIFPTDRFKLELWYTNGWQSYGQFDSRMGIGFQARYSPNGDWQMVSNNYYGKDSLGNPDRFRIHSDNSVLHKYYDNPKKKNGVSKAAFSFTCDVGGESGDGASIGDTSDPNEHRQYFLGFMAYNRLWFDENKYALTIGGGTITNPGRYLVLTPPVNGATNASGAGPFFTANPGDPFHAWDASICFDYMPSQFLTHRLELVHREANVPYFAGAGGMTPQVGPGNFQNVGAPGSAAANFDGTPFVPDLQKHETRIDYALMVKM